LRDQVLVLLCAEAERGSKPVKPEPPPLSPLQRLEMVQHEKVQRMLDGPPCRCGQCAREDAEARDPDPWRRVH
jgi:hypothetical protein